MTAERQTYYGNGVQPWDLMVAQGDGIPFARSSILKYVARAGKKPGESAEKDLRKARWYLDRMFELHGIDPRTERELELEGLVRGLRNRLRDLWYATKALYTAGFWRAKGVKNQKRLWEGVRDALTYATPLVPDEQNGCAMAPTVAAETREAA